MINLRPLFARMGKYVILEMQCVRGEITRIQLEETYRKFDESLPPSFFGSRESYRARDLSTIEPEHEVRNDR